MRDSALWTLVPELEPGEPDVDGPAAYWRLTHICGWQSNPQGEYDAKRTLEDVLRWAEHHEAECHNEPVGGTMDRTWNTTPAGWFVQTPKGHWLEVGHTSLQAGGVQHVSLIINGQAVVFPRDPTDPVKVRKGKLSPALRDEALESLESAFRVSILRDGEGPMQS